MMSTPEHEAVRVSDAAAGGAEASAAGRPLRRWQTVSVAAFVGIGAAALAGFMGLPAGGLYLVAGLESVALLAGYFGAGWGAVTGVIAAVVWCAVAFRSVRKGHARAAEFGALLGAAVGVLSTILLHAGLIGVLLYFDEFELWMFLVPAIGLPFGVVGGLILGALSGAMLGRFAAAGGADAARGA